MGQTAEVVAHLIGVTREQADAYAVESHQAAGDAQAQGFLKGEVETAFARDGKFYDHDDGVRPDSSSRETWRAQARLRAAMGAGDRRQFVADHRRRIWTILASEDAVNKYGLKPKAIIVDSQWAALDPDHHGFRTRVVLDAT
jgi:acetyl-CoA C-acetyltransferase